MISHSIPNLNGNKNVDIDYVQSEKEAKEKSQNIKKGNTHLVYFFDTDTSGEKLCKEFYTDRDEVDLNTYESLGVV